MRIGIGLPNQVRDVRSSVIPAWAERAEKAGFVSLGTVGRHAYPGVADTVALAAAAAVTSRAELITGVLLGPTWPAPLLAKELAGIDGVSGGRLTVGLGVGGREDDFVADGYGPRGRGARFDRDLEVYRSVWQGEPVGGGPNAAVPQGTRQIPMLFGGFAPAALDRMARWGEGYVGGSMPAQFVSPTYDAARDAWQRAGRDGEPRLVALVYFALADGDAGKRNVHDYYTATGEEMATQISAAVCDSPAKLEEARSSFADIGATDIVFNPATDDIDDIARLADVVL
ncbi:LLM class flavin-dependent oxidoreductase [Nocardia terpenica]|uniref:MmcJ protein n=1 Tax=Nocardia terpenica TaxID=455432 RepID=A0A164NGF3_9NOCA|nr:LLM class flavin-dependent oxidoreductase [Nocardia terpenica]KZM74337.1 MmcJ protein [Nocardia terpenica]NQE93080.1 LLM class flavin-dependent oxidoreductase [Nocardia terpenica]